MLTSVGRCGFLAFRHFDKLSDRKLNDYKPEIASSVTASSVTEVGSAIVSLVTGSRWWLSLSKPSSDLFTALRHFDKLSDRKLNDYKPEIASSVTEVGSATVSLVTGSRWWLSLSKPSSDLFTVLRHFDKLSDRKLSDRSMLSDRKLNDPLIDGLCIAL